MFKVALNMLKFYHFTFAVGVYSLPLLSVCCSKTVSKGVSTSCHLTPFSKKVQVGNDQEKRNQSETPTPKTEAGKTKATIRYLDNISKAM